MKSAPPANFGVGSSSLRNKPFSSYAPQPAVSPYLNLFRNDLNGQSQFNYQTLVQPQLQQQQFNSQVQKEALKNERHLQAISAQPAFNPQGSKEQYPTGHQTVFNYMGYYYQTPRQRPKKQAAIQ